MNAENDNGEAPKRPVLPWTREELRKDIADAVAEAMAPLFEALNHGPRKAVARAFEPPRVAPIPDITAAKAARARRRLGYGTGK